MQSAAQKLSNLDLSGPEARGLLADLVKNRYYAVDASIVNRSGELQTIEPVEFISFQGQDVSDQEHIIRLFRTEKPVLSWNFKAVEGFDSADLEYPIFNADKKLIGAVSILFKPEVLLSNLINEAVKGTDFNIWAMQPDGRIIYDIDTGEIGENLFIDPFISLFPSL
jgi:hypothetical protein